ncbi:hypothetical protein QTQ03_12890 [Micromonospora sp. WMMA1363]|uniref:hypothetical protein n=1 Tax=Micromonospora sp. WMMA1363 TaxID=3053985 RepID=UPI00259C9E48|nr:hypothetical protein [Micromonospora sp. WMMA1363]MDM4720428.1 hypothetical protein [Micromonospora sp. WMMA1363]
MQRSAAGAASGRIDTTNAELVRRTYIRRERLKDVAADLGLCEPRHGRPHDYTDAAGSALLSPPHPCRDPSSTTRATDPRTRSRPCAVS